MTDKTEQMFIPDALWQIVKNFLFSPPMCLLCKTEKQKVRNLTDKVLNKSGSDIIMKGMLTSWGLHLCKGVRKSDGTMTFSYVCNRHYALNNQMKIKLAQKEMFNRAREVVTHHKVGTKELRTNICNHLTKQDLMRLLCSKRSKTDVGKEVLTLCKIEL
jgi:hypothetical protein